MAHPSFVYRLPLPDDTHLAVACFAPPTALVAAFTDPSRLLASARVRAEAFAFTAWELGECARKPVAVRTGYLLPGPQGAGGEVVYLQGAVDVRVPVDARGCTPNGKDPARALQELALAKAHSHREKAHEILVQALEELESRAEFSVVRWARPGQDLGIAVGERDHWARQGCRLRWISADSTSAVPFDPQAHADVPVV